MNTTFFLIYPDSYLKSEGGNVRAYGFDMKMGIFIFRNKDYVVFKEPGGMYWASRGEQKYSPARFWVCKIIDTERDLESFHSKAIEVIKTDRLFEYEMPRKKRKETYVGTTNQLQTSAFLSGED